MASVIIYYYTGTGNSLFAARQLQEALGDARLAPMGAYLGEGDRPPEAEAVGLVFPICQTAMPLPVRYFLKRLRLAPTVYRFALATRIGTSHSAFATADRLLARQGRRLDLWGNVNMASNDPKFDYQVPTEEQLARLEQAACAEIRQLAEKINRREVWRPKDSTATLRIPGVALLEPLVLAAWKRPVKLYSDGGCTGCGLCAAVCPAGRIRLEAGRPRWQSDIPCWQCSACLSYCPAQSVQLKGFTEKNGRYPHPYATAEEIGAQRALAGR